MNAIGKHNNMLAPFRVSDLKEIVAFLETKGIKQVDIMSHGMVKTGYGTGPLVVCFETGVETLKVFRDGLSNEGFPRIAPTLVTEHDLASGASAGAVKGVVLSILKGGPPQGQG